MERADGAVVPHAFLPGSVIVKFRSGATQGTVLSAMRGVSGCVIERPSHADFEILTIPADADPEAVAAELRTQPDVEYAQPRYLNYPMLRPNDTFYDRQWNFPAIDMERAWDIQPPAGERDHRRRARQRRRVSNGHDPLQLALPVSPPGRRAGVSAAGPVDVPFAAAPELGDAKFVSPRDFIWDDDLPVDLDGHGTHVSGTVGQLTNNGVGVAGMAYNVRIMPVKVIDEVWDFIFGSPFAGTDDVVARGIRYAADNGAKVINMSIGRSGGGPSTVVDDAIRYAISRGAFVAVAAGNTGDTGNAPSRTAESAPNINGMIAVGAVGRSLQRAYLLDDQQLRRDCRARRRLQRRRRRARAAFSSRRSTRICSTPIRSDRSVTARRAPMCSAYYYFQGTSMATPHVAASPRCSCSRASRVPRRSRRRSSDSPATSAAPASTASSARASSSRATRCAASGSPTDDERPFSLTASHTDRPFISHKHDDPDHLPRRCSRSSSASALPSP